MKNILTDQEGHPRIILDDGLIIDFAMTVKDTIRPLVVTNKGSGAYFDIQQLFELIWSLQNLAFRIDNLNNKTDIMQIILFKVCKFDILCGVSPELEGKIGVVGYSGGILLKETLKYFDTYSEAEEYSNSLRTQ